MKIRSWLAVGAAVAATTVGAGAGASASTAAATHPAARSAVRSSAGHGRFHLLPNARLPLTRLPHSTVRAGAVSLGNWVGYAAPADRTVALRYVSAAFTVPSVNCANSPVGTTSTDSYQWVGLDGFNDTTEEATGIGATCTDGAPVYFAWYQLAVASTASGSSFSGINPGDAITASVYYNYSTGQYNFVLNDVTADANVINVNLACLTKGACHNASAEVIGQAVGAPPQFDLADYGMANVTAAGITSRDGQHGTLAGNNLWSSTELVMVDPSGVHMAAPSALYGGAAFNTTWLAGS